MPPVIRTRRADRTPVGPERRRSSPYQAESRGEHQPDRRLTNNTHRQPGPSVSTPPRKTPTADAMPADAAPDAERVAPGPAVVKRRGRIDSAAGKHHRGAEALGKAGTDQQPGSRASPPASEATPKRTVPATSTADGRAGRRAAAEQHESAVGEQIAAQDPLQVLRREMQVAGGSSEARHSRSTRRRNPEKQSRSSKPRVSLPRRVARKDDVASGGAAMSGMTSGCNNVISQLTNLTLLLAAVYTLSVR